MNRSVPGKQHQYEGSLAKSYESDRENDEKWRRENVIVAGLLDQVSRPLMRVLDVPVGTGRFLAQYSDQRLTVVGIDISDDMLVQARDRAEAIFNSKDDAEFRLGDITALPFAHKQVDISVCIRLLNLLDLKSVETALGELSRVTDGYIIVGVRTHRLKGVFRRTVRQLSNRVTGRSPKLTIHSEKALGRIFQKYELAQIEKILVTVALRGSSRYDIYLLKPSKSNSDCCCR